MTTTEPVRKRAHAAAAARIGVVGIASSTTLGLIAVMGASPPASETASPVAPPATTTTVAPAPAPAPVVIIVRRSGSSAAPPAARSTAPVAAAAPRPAPAPVAAARPVTRTSAS